MVRHPLQQEGAEPAALIGTPPPSRPMRGQAGKKLLMKATEGHSSKPRHLPATNSSSQAQLQAFMLPLCWLLEDKQCLTWGAHAPHQWGEMSWAVWAGRRTWAGSTIAEWQESSWVSCAWWGM